MSVGKINKEIPLLVLDNFSCHSGQAGDRFSPRLIRPLAEARPGIQEI
jgi:hypothetical protein